MGGFGDGGAVTSNSEELIKRVLQIGNHGRSEQYYHAIEGVNSRLDSIQAGVLDIKLRLLDAMNERRRSVADQYNRALVNNNYIEPPVIADYSKHVFHLYCVKSSKRDELSRYLKEKGISNGVYYPLPLHLQPAYAYLGYKKGDFPIVRIRLRDHFVFAHASQFNR